MAKLVCPECGEESNFMMALPSADGSCKKMCYSCYLKHKRPRKKNSGNSRFLTYGDYKIIYRKSDFGKEFYEISVYNGSLYLLFKETVFKMDDAEILRFVKRRLHEASD